MFPTGHDPKQCGKQLYSSTMCTFSGTAFSREKEMDLQECWGVTFWKENQINGLWDLLHWWPQERKHSADPFSVIQFHTHSIQNKLLLRSFSIRHRPLISVHCLRLQFAHACHLQKRSSLTHLTSRYFSPVFQDAISQIPTSGYQIAQKLTHWSSVQSMWIKTKPNDWVRVEHHDSL